MTASGRSRTTATVFAATAVCVVFLAACLAGSATSNVSIRTGTAYVGYGEVSILGDDGWAYSVEPGTAWTDAKGAWHDGGQPDCLPPVGQSGRATFATTEVTVNGFTWRPVVWISCAKR